MRVTVQAVELPAKYVPPTFVLDSCGHWEAGELQRKMLAMYTAEELAFIRALRSHFKNGDRAGYLEILRRYGENSGGVAVKLQGSLRSGLATRKQRGVEWAISLKSKTAGTAGAVDMSVRRRERKGKESTLKPFWLYESGWVDPEIPMCGSENEGVWVPIRERLGFEGESAEAWGVVTFCRA